LADAEYRDDKGKVAGEPGFKKPRPGLHEPAVADQAKEKLSTVAEQARETLSTVTDRASDAWDEASKRGADYYRQGSRAVSNADSTTVASLFIAGAMGFGIGWLVFGQSSREGKYISQRMSESSDRRY
jgi:ElaB/YqjD/DUF883 family membrane-anchored ribosome-binding protein